MEILLNSLISFIIKQFETMNYPTATLMIIIVFLLINFNKDVEKLKNRFEDIWQYIGLLKYVGENESTLRENIEFMKSNFGNIYLKIINEYHAIEKDLIAIYINGSSRDEANNVIESGKENILCILSEEGKKIDDIARIMLLNSTKFFYNIIIELLDEIDLSKKAVQKSYRIRCDFKNIRDALYNISIKQNEYKILTEQKLNYKLDSFFYNAMKEEDGIEFINRMRGQTRKC
jgi:hypothetical protein